MNHLPTIVLLGGSGLGPWAWGRVARLLEERGLRALTPQLRGTGNDPTSPASISLQEWVDDTERFLTEQDTDELVLVAHSFAGYVAAALLERDPDAVRKVVFLDAAIPAPGQSWFQVMGPEVERLMIGLAEDGAIPFFTRAQLDHFHPENGISDSDWAWMLAHLTPQPLNTCTQPAITRPLDPSRTPLGYVRCLHTAPPVADLTESTPAWTVRTLQAGHWPMITDPESTAEVLHGLASR